MAHVCPPSVGVIDDAVIEQGSAVHQEWVWRGREVGKVAVQNWLQFVSSFCPERGGCFCSLLFSPQSGTVVGKLSYKARW